MIKREEKMFITCKTMVSAYGQYSYNEWRYNLVAVCKVEDGIKLKIKVSDDWEGATTWEGVATKTIYVMPSYCIFWKIGRKWYTITTADELLEFREVLIKALEREEKKTKKAKKPMVGVVYQITGIIPYSGSDRHVLYTYLDKDKADEKYSELRAGDTYLDVQIDEYEVDG
jgi:hypothetical protein